MLRFNGKKFMEYVTSFSKIITIVWLAAWVETLLFSQAATIFNFGDATSLQYINDNVMQIGLIICGFYFCTKTLENLAQGIENCWAPRVEPEETQEEIEDGLDDNSESDI